MTIPRCNSRANEVCGARIPAPQRNISFSFRLVYNIRHTMADYRTITRAEAEPLIKSGRATKAGLYEPQHTTDGSEFVYVELAKGLTVFYRIKPVGA